jgi:predicted RNA binding protein YcfA (HicA-like mRNA interferase family)
MKAKELIKLLEENGWEEARQRGSHRIFKNVDFPINISVPDHGNKDLGKGLVSTILKRVGIK